MTRGTSLPVGDSAFGLGGHCATVRAEIRWGDAGASCWRSARREARGRVKLDEKWFGIPHVHRRRRQPRAHPSRPRAFFFGVRLPVEVQGDCRPRVGQWTPGGEW